MGANSAAKGAIETAKAVLLHVMALPLVVCLLSGCEHSNDPVAPEPGWEWQALAFPSDVRCVAVNPGGSVLVGATDGVYHSDDRGQSWHYLSATWSARHLRVVFDLATGPGGVVLCATPAGAYTTRDHGETWVLSRFANARGDTFGLVAAAVAPDGILFAGMAQESGGMFRSSNGGASWQQVLDIRGISAYSFGYITATNRNVVLFGTTFNRDFRSTNNGDFWVPFVLDQEAQFNVPYTTDLVPDGLGSLLACNHESIFHSGDDGASWGRVASGSAYTALAPGVPGEIFAGSYAGGVLRSTDSGMTWAAVGNSLEMVISSMAVGTGGELYVAAHPEQTTSRLFMGHFR